MPIYEYKCENGHVFEAIQRMTDEPLTACEECGAPASRVLTPPAIHFKGSGFHNTDYGTKRGGGNGGSESGGDSGGSSASKSKSDSGKSESKSDSKPAASTAD
ncbi:MAG TPA: FmdB family zinc ribbon protein [Solirubrobacterales bacterium]|jgi:putative FmdB family regulatory protein|nr:FmdB family zinc ribbon protein [Solirubrobacterales bacterium]